MNMEYLVLSLVILAFFSVGVVFFNGKGAFLIAGLNTMTENEKKKYDTFAVCRFMGKMMFSLSASMIFWLIAVVYNKDFLFVIGFILFMAITIFGVIYMNIDNRFIKKTKDS